MYIHQVVPIIILIVTKIVSNYINIFFSQKGIIVVLILFLTTKN